MVPSNFGDNCVHKFCTSLRDVANAKFSHSYAVMPTACSGGNISIKYARLQLIFGSFQSVRIRTSNTSGAVPTALKDDKTGTSMSQH